MGPRAQVNGQQYSTGKKLLVRKDILVLLRKGRREIRNL
jgi:hypothetical protein